jgi:hypothetical protein
MTWSASVIASVVVAEDWRDDAAGRVRAFGWALLAILIDLLFLGGIVVLNWAAQHFIFDQLKLHGSANFLLKTLEWTLAIATIGSVLSYVARDTLTVMARPWRRNPSDET